MNGTRNKPGSREGLPGVRRIVLTLELSGRTCEIRVTGSKMRARVGKNTVELLDSEQAEIRKHLAAISNDLPVAFMTRRQKDALVKFIMAV